MKLETNLYSVYAGALEVNDIKKNSLEFAYLLQLVFAIDEKDEPSAQEAFAKLDGLRVPFSFQNKIIAWAETYGASRKDTARVARELEDLLIDLGLMCR